ncbi:MAG: ABC transporter permease [Nitrospirae bacterium]|nr:ABC transporter permease [Nitrospirota bacterium]MBI5696482.1 ABC transporter permease [Nitrospirota bacterium]
MLRYLATRTFMMVPLLFGITVISFIVIHLAPGNPVDVATEMNPKASAQARENLKKLYGLDKPLHVQYYNWVKRFAKLDFGDSYIDGRPVLDKIVERLPVTISINILQLLGAFLIAMPLGILSAVRQNSFFDKATTVTVFLGFSMPSFWLGLLLMILFGVELGWLPISGIQSIDVTGVGWFALQWDRLQHIILIVFLGAFGGLAGISRYIRSNMLEVVNQDYVRTARAKGLTENAVIYKHALRNAMMPVITILGLSVPGLIGGSVILEYLFAIPGMGQLFWQSVTARDYPLVMGNLAIGAFLTLVGNMLADISYAIVDPRVKVS